MAIFFFEVAPASRLYHGRDPLIYSSESILSPGTIVEISLKNKKAYGFVVKKTKKPNFSVKKLIATSDTLPLNSLRLFEWLNQYYPSPLGITAQHFIPSKLLTPSKPTKYPNTKPSLRAEPEISLSKDQQMTINKINSKSSETYILHGETSSGKTRVYIEAVRKAINDNQSALILVPEIGLSPQANREFSKVFDGIVLTYHSDLTPLQKREIWTELLNSTSPKIVIGPRSALFLPFNKLGVIVVDEFHDTAYKQESTPYYNSLRVASKLAQLHVSNLVFGSATPPINELAWAKQKSISVLKMSALPSSSQHNIKIISVDLAKKSELSNQPLLSTTLIKNINSALAQKTQVLLFLNKRGSSRAIVCQDCGWRIKCKNCDLPLTYHQDTYKLVCHTCGFTQTPPTSCPECTSTNIVFRSPGTKSIVASLKKIFPNANIARFDKDNLKSERINSKFDDIKTGKIDILVGTQILAKGHDLPKLGLVGILQAESSLNFPDYTANEKSYQVIHQLIGRVGRNKQIGTVIIQSYTPDNPLIKLATNRDWQAFYDSEIIHRKSFDFPPFYHVLKISSARTTPASAQKSLKEIATSIRGTGVKISGPTPSFIEKKQNKYYWQLIIKSKKRTNLVKIVRSLPNSVTADLDPSHLL